MSHGHDAVHRRPPRTRRGAQRPRPHRARLRDEWNEPADVAEKHAAERLPSRIAIDGCAFPDRNAGRGEVWVSAELSRDRLREVVEHEVRHVAQGAAILASEDLAETDASAYPTRSRMALIDELHGGGRSPSVVNRRAQRQ